MDFGQIIFLAFLAVLGVLLYIKRKPKKTIIDEKGTMQMQVDAAREATALAKQAKRDARGGS